MNSPLLLRSWVRHPLPIWRCSRLRCWLRCRRNVLDQLQAQLPGIEALRVAYNRGVQDTTAGLGTNGSEVVKQTRQVGRSLRNCIFTPQLLTFVASINDRHAKVSAQRRTARSSRQLDEKDLLLRYAAGLLATTHTVIRLPACCVQQP